MNLSDKSKVLLERYLLAVERRLPLQGRKDMIAESKANFMDTLEDKPAPEEILSEDVLEAELREELGSPRSVAAAYFSTDALIGPQYNSIFRLAVTILVPIVVGAVTLASIIALIVDSGENPFFGIWQMIGSAWQAAVGVIGTVAIILMVLTRFFPQLNKENLPDFFDDEQKDWSVIDLPELVVEKEKIQTWEPIVGIAFGVLFVVIFLFFFDEVVGMWWMQDDKQWHIMPVFTEAFKRFIPWMVVNAGLGILLDGLLLYQGRRSILARFFEIVIKVSEISLVGTLLNAGTLVFFDKSLALSKGFPESAIEGMQTLFRYDFVHWFLVFLLVVLIVDLVKKGVDLVRGYYPKQAAA